MSDNVNAAINNKPCSHFSNYLSQYGRSSFSVVNAYFSTPISKEARRQKVSPAKVFPKKHVLLNIEPETMNCSFGFCCVGVLLSF